MARSVRFEWPGKSVVDHRRIDISGLRGPLFSGVDIVPARVWMAKLSRTSVARPVRLSVGAVILAFNRNQCALERWMPKPVPGSVPAKNAKISKVVQEPEQAQGIDTPR
jgi:hypothetical protein